MGINKYVSDIKIVAHNQKIVFDYLSDIGNLSGFLTDNVLSLISDKIPQIPVKNFESDRDSCRFEVGSFGKSEVRIVERTPFTTIKIVSQGGLPMELTLWIQLLPVDEDQTKMRLTLHAELGIMLKMMIGNKLEEGINQLAEILAMLPYR